MMQVGGILTGDITGWKEETNKQLVTVGSSDLIHLKAVDDNVFVLTKSKIGIRSNTLLSKHFLSGHTYLNHEGFIKIVTLSKNGSVYLHKDMHDKNGSKDIKCEKILGYLCYHCITQYNDHNMMEKHVERQHLGPVSCKMCGDNWEDIQQLHIHQKCCSYKCEVPGCESSHKRLVEAKNHHNKYLKSL